MFSIVIPLYNKEKFILKTLESIINQTFKDFEIIIVDDGSTDNGVKVVEQINDSRITIYRKPNGGVSKARNYGISYAKYDFIAFMDADDSWYSDYLYSMSELILKYPECGIFGSAHNVIFEHKTISNGINVPEGIVENWFKTMLETPVSWTSATIVKKSVFDNVGGFPVGMVAGQDTFVWVKIVCKYKMAFTPKILASYHMTNSGGFLRVGKLDTCPESWIDFYEKDQYYKNEFIAEKGIVDGLRYISGYHREKSKQNEKLYSYTTLFKRRWRILYMLNRSPKWGIDLYKKIYNNYIRLKNRY